MKAKEKRASRKSSKRMYKYVVVAFAVLVVSVLVFMLVFPQPAQPYHPDPNTFYFKAAIVDEESLTYPNPDFVQNVTTTLQNGGFTVDYIEGTDVTVDFYKNLPTHNYGIVILRAHAGVLSGTSWVSLCTSENYSTQKYVWEQLNDELIGGKLTSTGEDVFSLGPNFKMNGHFENTLIIMMGCDGLFANKSVVSTGFAQMLIRNGAKAYLGWSGGVTASCSDNAVQQLLQNLIVKRWTLGAALSVAPSDPVTQAILNGYPHNEISFVIPQNNQTS